MVVLLTGGTGYIGRYVAQRCLAEGWSVHLLTRATSVFPVQLAGRVARHDHNGSFVRLREILEAVHPDCVLHLASEPVRRHDPDQIARLLEANITLPTLLIEAMRVTGVRDFVNTGTFWQHYSQASYWPVDFYAATKQAFEDLLRHYTDAHGLSVMTLKLFDTYGPDDHRGRIMNMLVDAAQTGGVLNLSAGDQILDLTHADDVGRAFVHAARLLREAKRGTNLSYFVSGERMSLKQLVQMIDEGCGNSLNVALGALPYRDRQIMEPIDPVDMQLPGWLPEHKVSATLQAMLGGNGTSLSSILAGQPG